MNRIKIYNSEGEEVDFFTMPSAKHIMNSKHPNKNAMVRTLNSHGFYLKSQLSKLKQIREAHINEALIVVEVVKS